MSIVAMNRVTLCGVARDKAAVLDGLQTLGVLHIIPLSEPGPLTPDDPAVRRRAETSFRHIMEAPERPRPYHDRGAYDHDAVIAEIMANRLRLRELSDRRDTLAAHIEGIAPWGDFTLPPSAEIGGERLWLYAVPLKERAALNALALPWEIVGRTPTEHLVVVISPEEPPFDLLPTRRTETEPEPLSMLRDRLEALEIEVEKTEHARAELSRWRVLLGIDLAAALDLDDLHAVEAQTLAAEEVFAIQGWAPKDAGPAIGAFARTHGLALMAEAPGRDDGPPTLLRVEDSRMAIAGDLTRFYQSPGYRTWDPSLIVFASFAIFFAMIIADAGYGVLFSLGTAAFWRRMGASDAGRRARVLLAILAGATVVYGVLAGSYFGINPPEGSPLGWFWIIDVGDFQTMMVISVMIGVLHIALALGTVAWLNRGTSRSITAMGWIVVLAAGPVIWLGGETARVVGLLALIAGLGAVFCGAAADRPVTKRTDWLLRVSDGFLGLTGVTKLFGDVLSYLRLFALGLASASLASTFNDLAGQVHDLHPGLGLLLSIAVLIFGHTINVIIGVMSGVVHGLRLNYVEFFGWGLTEEGYPFRAFAKRGSPA